MKADLAEPAIGSSIMAQGHINETLWKGLNVPSSFFMRVESGRYADTSLFFAPYYVIETHQEISDF